MQCYADRTCHIPALLLRDPMAVSAALGLSSHQCSTQICTVGNPVVWCCSNAETVDHPDVTRTLSNSSGEQDAEPAQRQDNGHIQQQQQPQQQATAQFPALRHPAFAEGIQRVNSPMPAQAFDAAAYAAAAAARTASPGGLLHPLCLCRINSSQGSECTGFQALLTCICRA